LSLPAAAQVKITAQPDKVAIDIAGKPFTTFYMSGEAFTPRLPSLPLAPARSLAAPQSLAPGPWRPWPKKRTKRRITSTSAVFGSSTDNVNKLDFWNNEWSYFADAHRQEPGPRESHQARRRHQRQGSGNHHRHL
jgi:hypothetical protein